MKKQINISYGDVVFIISALILAV